MKFDKSLFSFEGRARRSQFWLTRILIFVAFVVVSGVLAAIGRAVDPAAGQPGATSASPVTLIIGLLTIAIGIVAVWIDLAVAVARCFVCVLCGWFFFFALIPIICGFWL